MVFRENTIFLPIPCHFLRLFLVFRRENTIFLRLLCYFLRFSDGKHTLPRLIPRENAIFLTTLFSYKISIISLSFAWIFIGETLFSYGFRVISLGFVWFFRRENTIFFRAISLGFQKENIRYLGYSSGKSDFPDNTIFLQNVYHFLMFCLDFARENTIFLRIPCHFLSVFLVFPRENAIFLTTLFSYKISIISLSYGFRVISLGFQTENIRYLG